MNKQLATNAHMIKLPDSEQFNLKDVVIAGDDCYLITPSSMGTSWTDDNARFRSCVVRKSDNFVISQGFKKFTNWGEKPDFQPWNDSWLFEARHKLDGSLLIVSCYKGEWILRTRGTVDARQLPNGHEIDLLMEKYKHFFKNDDAFDSVSALRQSLLFEWTTPSNIIVLRESDEFKLTLIGAVSNEEGEYYSQKYLDECASEYKFDRPDRYEYNSVKECIMDVSIWRGKEGVVLYSPDGQTLKKIKADEYCELHKLAAGVKGIKQVLDVFIASPKFTEEKEFYNYVETTLSFEIAEKCKDFIKAVSEAYSKFVCSVNSIERVVDCISKLDSRKKQAMAIQEHWDGWMVAVAFSLLDKKLLDDKIVKKSMEKLLEL